MKTIQDLIDDGILRFAIEPANNPQSLDFPHVVMPLIEHDYPAKTAIMWNMAYERFGIETRNVMMVADPTDLPIIFSVFRTDPKYLGGGAGVGFKDTSVEHLDNIEEVAEQIGSINFQVKDEQNKIKGYNTDGEGYVQSLQDYFSSKGRDLVHRKIVMLGAGGTANSIAFALAQRGANLVILNRTVAVAENLAKKINNFFGLNAQYEVLAGGEDRIALEVPSADAIVNVSTKGAAGALEAYSALAPAQMPVTEESIRANLEQSLDVLNTIPKTTLISDILLTKKPTPFMETAMEAGYETLGGIPMVINQGVEAFWILHHKELLSKGVTKSDVKDVMTQAATNP